MAPIDVVWMKLNLYRFPDDSVHMPQLLGQNTGVVYPTIQNNTNTLKYVFPLG
jgi:hypothetical protein